MQIIIQKPESYCVEITIRESGKEFEKFRLKSIDHLRERANIKGFRKGGNIPNARIIEEFGEAYITQHAIEDYLDSIWKKVLSKTGIVPVAPGELKGIKSTSPLELTLEVEILPEVDMDEKGIESIKLQHTPVIVTDIDIDTRIREIETRFTTFTKGEEGGIVAIGDRVTIDAQGFDEKGGKEIAETKTRGMTFVVGSGTTIPGFDDHIIGHRVGDVVEFEVTFPADYAVETFRERKVFFIATLFECEKAREPEWTEQFIEDFTGKKMDYAGFRTHIRSQIETEETAKVRATDETRLLEEVAKYARFEVGKHLLAHETDRIYEEYANRLREEGQNITDILRHVGMDMDQFKKDQVEPEALRRVRSEILLRKLREVRKTDITPEEVSGEIETIIARYGSEEVRERLRKKLVPGDYYYDDILLKLSYHKVIESFFSE